MTNVEQLCMGCMGERGDADLCPLCGWAEGTPPDLPVQLAPRTVICEKYLLGRVLGQGGFGITYLAWDLLLNRKLAIKEYFPREICGRGRDSLTLQPLSQKSQHDYRYGLEKFVEEGRNLAHFRDYPGIVSLLDFFEANGTAYIVMAYMEGMTFKQYLEEQGGKITFDLALTILNPVMDALCEVHRAGMLHRDISPDNIYLNRDRQIKILDFGATRYAMREQSQNLTVLIKPGYAPLEQYSSGGKQGPWSDVYATGATFYRALTGRAPSEAPDRLAQDDLVPPSKASIAIPPVSEGALVKALAVHYQGRFQTMEEFQKAIVPKPPGPVPIPTPIQGKSSNPALLALAVLLLFTTLGSAAMWVNAHNQLKAKNSTIEDLNRRLEGLQNGSSLKKQLDDLKSQLSQSQDRLQASTASLSAAESEREALSRQVASLTQELNSRKMHTELPQKPTPPAPALTLAYFQIYSSADGVNRLPGSANQFSSNTLRFVLCQLGGPNPLHDMQNLSTGIEVKFYGPGGALRRVISQDVSATRSQVLWTSQAVWGSPQPGTFQSGQWRIEVWAGPNKLGEKSFQVN